MKDFIARYSATNELYFISAKNADAAYRHFGKDVLKMTDADDPGFDTGNVDIDLWELPDHHKRVEAIKFE